MVDYLWLPQQCVCLGLPFQVRPDQQAPGNEVMSNIAGNIREGAMAFLSAEYKQLAIFVLIVAGLLAFANSGKADSNALIALSFVVGAICSGLAGYVGMRVATAANVRTTNAAQEGLPREVPSAAGPSWGWCRRPWRPWTWRIVPSVSKTNLLGEF